MAANEIFLKNIDLLVDMSEEMLERAPFEAYALLKLAQSVRPNGPRIRNLLRNIEQETRKNWIVAWRHDGLCERLSAILIGYFSAKALNLDFKFIWPDRTFLESFFQTGVDWHDVPTNPRTVLSSSFVDQYLVNENDILHPQGIYSSNRLTAERMTVETFEMVSRQHQLIRPCWLASSRMFPDLDNAFSKQDFRSFLLDTLLSEGMKDELQAMPRTDLPALRIALHVRGGDIIYGDTRFAHGFSRLKSITLAVAEKICETYAAKGCAVLVFGASISDLDYLAAKFPNVVQLSRLEKVDRTGLGGLLHDILAMSECEKIISSADTAVTRFAAMLGEASVVSVPDMFDDIAEYEILLAYVSELVFESAHPLQKAFTYWSLFVTSAKGVSDQIRLDHIQSACDNDSENTRYFIYAYFLSLILEKYEKAELISELISQQLKSPAATYFKDGRLGQLGISISDPLFLELLVRADAVPNKPVRATQNVRVLLQKVAPQALKDFHKREPGDQDSSSNR